MEWVRGVLFPPNLSQSIVIEFPLNPEHKEIKIAWGSDRSKIEVWVYS